MHLTASLVQILKPNTFTSSICRHSLVGAAANQAEKGNRQHFSYHFNGRKEGKIKMKRYKFDAKFYYVSRWYQRTIYHYIYACFVMKVGYKKKIRKISWISKNDLQGCFIRWNAIRANCKRKTLQLCRMTFEDSRNQTLYFLRECSRLHMEILEMLRDQNYKENVAKREWGHSLCRSQLTHKIRETAEAFNPYLATFQLVVSLQQNNRLNTFSPCSKTT